MKLQNILFHLNATVLYMVKMCIKSICCDPPLKFCCSLGSYQNMAPANKQKELDG